MCEFKVGDLVAHKDTGNKYVVKRASTRHLSFDGYEKDYDAGAFELVERKQEKPAPYIFKVAHTFAVGDKGKTRAGSEYTIIAEHNNKLVCHYTSTTGADLGYGGASRNGMSYDGCSVWLLPPTKTMWRVELTGVKDPKTSGLLDMTATRYYDTEENARKGIARGVRSYITVKGPFPEEREA